MHRHAVKSGCICLFSLNDAIGHEEKGTGPALIITKHEQSSLITVVPFTSRMDAIRFPYTCKIKPSKTNGWEKESVAMIFQLKSISDQGCIKCFGILEEYYIQIINKNTQQFLNL